MTTETIISTDQTTAVAVTQSDTSLTVLDGISVHTTSDPAISSQSGLSNLVFNIDGEVISDASTGIRIKAGMSNADYVSPIITIGENGHVKGATNYAILIDAIKSRVENAGLIEGQYGLALGEDATVENLGEIKGGQYGVMMSQGAADSVINNSGKISGHTAISESGANALINNEADGEISGTYGIYHDGTGGTINNAGTISGTTLALYMEGSHNEIVNSGQISGSVGVEFMDAHMNLTNSGEITATDTAIKLGWLADDVTITNSETISSTNYAIYSAGGTMSLTNSGTISGKVQLGDDVEKIRNKGSMNDVDLGGGKDLFDGRGGTVDGEVSGGLGDDTFVVSSKLSLVEGTDAGTDTVKSSISWTLGDNFEELYLTGRKDANGLGNELANTLTGNKGDNELSGLAGADTFVFAKGFGKDTITDFENGADQIDLSGWKGVESFADLKAHHLTIDGDDLVITNGEDTLTLLDTGKVELDASDFIF